MIYLNDKSSDLKLYSRGKYSNGLPHTSEDIHQETDLSLRKLGLILDSITGSCMLEQPLFDIDIQSTYTNLRLSKPITVNLNGEVFLVGNSESINPLSISNNFTGTVILICWYTNVTSSSILYEYGGLCNNTMNNDIMDENLSVQTSSRYQVRWNLGYCINDFDYSNPVAQNISVLGEVKTEAGVYNDLNFVSPSLNGKFYKYNETSRVPSADGFVNIIPIANVTSGVIKPCKIQNSLYGIESQTTPKPDQHKVWYNPNTEEIRMYFNGGWRNVGGSQVFNQEEEPTGDIKEGSIWYNPSLGEFKFYISGLGFVDSYAKMGFVQLQSTYIFSTSFSTPQNITVSIPIDTYLSSDLLRVSYEGVELIKGTNYTVNESNKTITLLNFTSEVGDTVLFTLTRLIGSSDLMTTLTLLENHINDFGNSTASGHLKLSDTPSDVLTQDRGVAATPKAVKDVENKINVLVDETTGELFELGVSEGLLFIRKKV